MWFTIYYLNLLLMLLICLGGLIWLLRKVVVVVVVVVCCVVVCCCRYCFCCLLLLLLSLSLPFIHCSLLLSLFLPLPFPVSGHELKGLMAYSSLKIPGLHYPLMTLVDYRGFRLIAISLLPLEPARSLIYGTSDAGVTVHNRDPEFSEKMEKAARSVEIIFNLFLLIHFIPDSLPFFCFCFCLF